jgi:glucose-6-phosphate dehydrogenase assembly protein OpcA
MAGGLDPDAILKELDRLWGALGRQEAGDSHGVLRACSMTLIVFARDGDDLGETLAEVMREHPNRTIIVRPGEGATPQARVTAQCWMPFGRRQQICAEQIEIDAARDGMRDLEPALIALRAPDLPVVAWRRGAQLPEDSFADKVIVDSAQWPDPRAALGRLAELRRAADLAWARITRWREMVAQAFENPAISALLARLSAVRVLHGGERPPAEAFYLAGWISSALGREVAAQFEAVPGAAGAVEGFELTGPEQGFQARRVASDYVDIRAGSLHACVGCARQSESALLGEELRIVGRDPVYHKAVGAAARLAAR